MLSSAGTVYGSSNFLSYQEDSLPFQENSYGILLKAMENYLILQEQQLQIVLLMVVQVLLVGMQIIQVLQFQLQITQQRVELQLEVVQEEQ